MGSRRQKSWSRRKVQRNPVYIPMYFTLEKGGNLLGTVANRDGEAGEERDRKKKTRE